MRIAIYEEDEQRIEIMKYLMYQWQQKNKEAPLVIQEYHALDQLRFALEDGCEFDVYFISVNTPELDGINVAEIIRKRDRFVPINFMMASEESIRQLRHVQIFKILLDPLIEEDISECLDYVYHTKIIDDKYFFVLKSKERVYRVRVCDISYIVSDDHKVYVHLRSKNQYEINRGRNMKEIVAFLGDDSFIQIHRSYIVNIHDVQSYSSNNLRLFSGKELSIGRAFQKSVLTTLKKVFCLCKW